MDRLELLELIAEKVEIQRALEHEMVQAQDPARLVDELRKVRFEIDVLLRELRATNVGESSSKL